MAWLSRKHGHWHYAYLSIQLSLHLQSWLHSVNHYHAMLLVSLLIDLGLLSWFEQHHSFVFLSNITNIAESLYTGQCEHVSSCTGLAARGIWGPWILNNIHESDRGQAKILRQFQFFGWRMNKNVSMNSVMSVWFHRYWIVKVRLHHYYGGETDEGVIEKTTFIAPNGLGSLWLSNQSVATKSPSTLTI